MSKVKDENCGIYTIINKVNCKLYIGSSRVLKRRKNRHFSDLKHNRHDNYYLQSSWNKNGAENFEWKILEFCNEGDLIKREQYYIDYYNSTNPSCGYNLMLKADNSVLTEKCKSRALESAKGRKMSEYNKEQLRLVHKGKILSEETKKKISDKKKGSKTFLGKKHSQETKDKIGEKNKGCISFLGKKHTEESKQKMSEKRKGRILTGEWKENISKSLVGNKRHLGVKHTEETKKKIGKKSLEMWKKRKLKEEIINDQ